MTGETPRHTALKPTPLDTPTPSSSHSNSVSFLLQTSLRPRAPPSAPMFCQQNATREISIDQIERERRSLERDIQAAIGHTYAANNNLLDSSASEDERPANNRFKARVEDYHSSASSETDDDLSLKIALSPPRRGPARPAPEPTTTGDLSYLTASRAASPALASPPKRSAPAPQKSFLQPRPAATAAPSMARDFRREFERVADKENAGRAFGAEIGNVSARRPAIVGKDELPKRLVRAPPPAQQHQVARSPVRLPDVTGLTEGIQSPEKARVQRLAPSNGASSGRGTPSADVPLTSIIAQLRAKLQVFQDTNKDAEARIRELENKVVDRPPLQPTRPSPGQGAEWRGQLADEERRRKALESLVSDLRSQVSTLTTQLTAQSATLARLQASAPDGPRRTSVLAVEHEIATLREGLEALGEQVQGVKYVVEELLREKKEAERQREDPDRTPRAARTAKAPVKERIRLQRPSTPQKQGRSFLQDDEIDRLRRELQRNQLASSSEEEPEEDGNQHLRSRMDKVEAFLHGLPSHRQGTRETDPKVVICSICRKKRKEGASRQPQSAPAKVQTWRREDAYDGETESDASFALPRHAARPSKPAPLPKADPRIALQRVLQDLEEDFAAHRNIYIELSTRYRSLGSKEATGKRRALAEHLKESIDVLEGKARQVKKLHDLLHAHEDD